MPALRVLIADDERPARRFLANLLAELPEVELVGEASNGQEAVTLIEQQRPDLALLDLHMPELGGLDAARMISRGATPAIAFVTAFDEFAVQAFELNAVDYLLKPVEKARLAATIDRARSRLRAGAAERARAVTAAATAYDSATRRTFLERIPVREGATLHDATGHKLGHVTSGTLSPTVDKPIAMAYLAANHAHPANEVYAEVRGKRLPMRVTAMPFAPHRYQR